MHPEPINLLNEPEKRGSDPSQDKKRAVTYTALALLILSITAVLFGHYLALTRASASQLANNGQVLTPQSKGFFQTIRNFIFHSTPELQGNENDRINILLLGIGGTGHDGPYLSDTNMIVSIRPSTKEVALISIPRDLAVTIPGHGVRKINNADAFGEAKDPGKGGDFARQVFSDTFKIDIPYYVRVDFKAFEELVDEVGGITVNVPKTFTDTSFPGANYSYTTIHFDAGEQTMNGQQALEFSRSRHGNNGEGSDFARAFRQQLVIAALKEKMLSAGTYTNPLILQKMWESLTTHVTTNLTLEQLLYFAGFAKSVTGDIKHLVLDSSVNGFLVNATSEDGAFMLFPKTGNFDIINLAIQNVFAVDSTTITGTVIADNVPNTPFNSTHTELAPARVEIQNGTWRVGLASRTKKRLEEQGFSVLAIGNSLQRPLPKTALYILNQKTDKAALATLSKIFKVTPTATLPDWLKESYDNPKTDDNEGGMKYNKETDILIILGEDASE